MLIKTNKWKENDVLAWDASYLQSTSKPEELKKFIKEHGEGPFLVLNSYKVVSKDKEVKWIKVQSFPLDKNICTLQIVDESCFLQIGIFEK